MARQTRRKSTRINGHMNTKHRLTEWFKDEYEKLGWMVLAKAKGHGYKIPTYKKAIDQLLKSIQHVMTQYQDPDRIHDLKVLEVETRILKEYVAKHL